MNCDKKVIHVTNWLQNRRNAIFENLFQVLCKKNCWYDDKIINSNMKKYWLEYLDFQMIHICKHTHIGKYHSQIIVPHYHKTFCVTVLQLTLFILCLYIFLAYKHTQNCKNKSSMSKNVIYSYWINHTINHPQ